MAQVTMISRPPRVRSAAAAAMPIDVGHIDTNGRELRLHTLPTAHRAVRSRVVELGEWVVTLDILAASHRVSVRSRPAAASDLTEGSLLVTETEDLLLVTETEDLLLVTETVACGSPDASIDRNELPSSHGWSSQAWQMHFSSKIVHGADEMAFAAAQIDCLHGVESAVVGQFPGNELALTALVVDLQTGPGQVDDGLELAWHSWHLYPGDHPHAVITHTIARPPSRTNADRKVRC